MVMSGGGSTDSNDPDKESEVLDWSYQNHTDGLLRGGKHCGSSFKRAILDNADLTEGDFTNCDFSLAVLRVGRNRLLMGLILEMPTYVKHA